MKTKMREALWGCLTIAILFGASTLSSAAVDFDTAKIEQLTSLKGALNEAEGVFKVSAPRIHHHMTHETPRILFLHYWGKGKAQDLANGIKTALQAQTK